MIQSPATQPDELAAGYRARIRITSGFEPSQFKRVAREVGDSWISVLSLLAGKDVGRFAQMHTLLPYRNAFDYVAAGRAHGTWEPESVQLRMALALIQPGPRVCGACIDEDRGFWGFPYFRRTHQLPGVNWCIKHNEPLSTLPHEALDDLPVQGIISTAFRREVDEQLACAAVRRFADISAALLVNELVASETELVRALHEAAGQCDVDLSFPAFGQFLVKSFPLHWLDQVLAVRYSSKGEQRLDRLSLECGGPKSKPTVIYVLALAALFTSSDQALSSAISNTRRPPRVAAMEDKRMDVRLIAAAKYFREGMTIRQAADEQGIDPSLLEDYVRAGFSLPKESISIN